MNPLMIDLFCGLGGWAEGGIAEGFDVIGFDVERHDYGTGGYPGQLMLQDVLTLHGRQFRNATLIVASPPCQAYSYRAMPWKRAKVLTPEELGVATPAWWNLPEYRPAHGKKEVEIAERFGRRRDLKPCMTLQDMEEWTVWKRNHSKPPPDNSLFDACLRIQREASEAAGRHIPLVVENVRGAEKWVGRAAWHYGSYYLWGDVPALMPAVDPQQKFKGFRFYARGKSFQTASVEEGRKVPSESGRRTDPGKGARFTSRDCGVEGVKFGSRKAASAMIAKIPFPLAQHIARTFKGGVLK
jgi:hypothetical protein